MDDLYFLKARVPKASDVKTLLKTSPKEIKQFFNEYNNVDEAITSIKQLISRIDNKIPLYDEYSKNLYLVSRSQVYSRVIYNHYRFPDNVLFEILQKRKDKLKDKIQDISKVEELKLNLDDFSKDYKIHYQLQSSSYFIIREYRKLSLMIKFLNSFDLDILEDTYIKVFYYYSNEVGKNITVCKRPSFLPHFKHINPYYTRSELINLALNLEKIKPSDKYYSQEDILQLCEIIKKNDIDKDILLKHQKYIISNNKVGIVEYYSLQGSYFMNQYMRGYASYKFKNKLLEDGIESMWKLINSAPPFDKSYILYRFIKNDPHLKDIEIGENYIEKGFTSTTRNPFYRSDVYKFGFILIKIKIPANVKGVALCMETISKFPEEQEIILAPHSILRLDSKDENTPFFHIDDNYESKIRTRYEFTYLGKADYEMPDRELHLKEKVDIDFLRIEQTDSISMEEKIRFFVSKYVNPMYQFSTKIGNKSYDLIVEWYDSTEAYKKFYSVKTNNGFSIYTLLDDYLGFMIEIGEDTSGSYMHVNYYFRYSSTNRNKIIPDKDFIDFLARLSFYFQVKYIRLYADYTSCDLRDKKRKDEDDYKSYQGGNYCTDFYSYLKDGKKRYSELGLDKTVLYSGFDYYDLDRMKSNSPLKILSKNDSDEIYQIYKKTYEPFVAKEKHTLSDFYLYLIDNHCFHVSTYVSKMKRFFKDTNPFEEVFYILDGITYLYNKELISYIPSIDDNLYGDEDTKPKNEYRSSESRVKIVRGPRSRLVEEVLEIN